jgi:hypothetical protein
MNNEARRYGARQRTADAAIGLAKMFGPAEAMNLLDITPDTNK